MYWLQKSAVTGIDSETENAMIDTSRGLELKSSRSEDLWDDEQIL